MLRTRLGRAGPDRRGVILMVVLAMLTLFALVGITFVLVADSAATSARIARQTENQFRPDIEPEAALALALGQLLYDLDDDVTGITSALRGQSLARNLYGWRDDRTGTNQPLVPLDKPGIGPGRVHLTGLTGLGAPWDDEAYLMNYQYFARDGFIRDPERYPPQNSPGYRRSLSQTRGAYVGFNVPYTYPDHNNFFLAQIDPQTGRVVTPSFHRDYLFGSLLHDPNNPSANPNWTSTKPIGTYLTLRPRPVDHADSNGNSQFPYPVDQGGDVKNLDWAPGGADSIWIDIGAPVLTSGDGRKYKMLVAPLILDLGGRLDLNAVGNVMGGNQNPPGLNRTHVSNQGLGVWEINPHWLVSDEDEVNPHAQNPLAVANTMRAQVRHLLVGQTSAANVPWGRYNQRTAAMRTAEAQPQLPVNPPAWNPLQGTTPRQWARVDYNGHVENAANAPSPDLLLPGSNNSTARLYQIEPYFAPNTYGNGVNENTTNHAAMYNVYHPVAPNLRFPLTGMVRTLRWGGSGSEMQTSDVVRLLPTFLNGGHHPVKRRNYVTLLSAYLDRATPTPYVWSPTDDRYQYQYGVAGEPYWSYPKGNNIPFPAPPFGQAPPAGSEFDSNWQSNLGGLIGKINLNRPLQDYPPVDPATGLFLQDTPARQAQLTKAIQDRQAFARDLFEALWRATGAADPATIHQMPAPAAESAQFMALRWLAQLAVNIVDYIDSDGYSTPFPWYTNIQNGRVVRQDHVFGVELPRLVMNEIYAQYDNYHPDIVRQSGVYKVRANGDYLVNVWVELHNPIPDDGRSDCIAQLHNGNDAVYTIVMLQNEINTPAILKNPANVTGDPDFGAPAGTTRVLSAFKSWGTENQVRPFPTTGNPRFQSTDHRTGFYVVGPPAPATGALGHYPTTPAPSLAMANPRFPTVTTTSPAWLPAVAGGPPVDSMAYNIRATSTQPPHPTILLRRLANPGLRYNNNPGDPLYNPYITVDFVQYRNPADVGQINDCRMFDRNGPIGGSPPARTARSAWGRPQPYTAGAVDWGKNVPLRKQQPPAAGDHPHNTFFRHNSTAANPTALYNNYLQHQFDPTLKVPFDWLVHLDRQLISPIELWHVAACKPHELTQAFFNPSINPANRNPYHQQAAPWSNASTRLYRFLECVETSPLGYGLGPQGRVPGRVNINAVWNGEILRALADPPPVEPERPRPFTQDDVDEVSKHLFALRSPNSHAHSIQTNPHAHFLYRREPVAAPTDDRLTNTPDKPFWSLGLGPTDLGVADPLSQNLNLPGHKPRGLDNTILRPRAANTLLFEPPSLPPTAHPYQRMQLFTKIYNHLTTRSDVFAVWLTVGYFEVLDESTQPVRLGAEIGKAENREIRHRMFAIVDRTQMSVFKATGTNNQAIQPGSPVTVTVTVPAGSGTISAGVINDARTNKNWRLAAGTVLTLDEGLPTEETVVVQSVNPGVNRITFTPRVRHNPTVSILCRGNPGPWTTTKYDPRQDTDVVPFFSVID